MRIVNMKSNSHRGRRALGGGIRMAAAFGTAALLIQAISLASAEDYRWGGTVEHTRPTNAAIGPIFREADIAGLRAALHLTPDQRPHWIPVEAALNELAQHEARAEAPGYVRRFSERTSALAATAARLRRLQSIAMPLIMALNENQKRAAVSFARRMGYGSLVAML